MTCIHLYLGPFLCVDTNIAKPNEKLSNLVKTTLKSYIHEIFSEIK